MTYDTYQSPIGLLYLIEMDNALVGVGLKKPLMPKKQTPLTRKVIAWLSDYFHHQSRDIDFPIKISGTPFKKTVYQALLDIPYGETLTYGALSKKLDTSPRAVGQALGKNPLLIIVPCHRVLGKTDLGGYALGIHTKKFLLDLEKR